MCAAAAAACTAAVVTAAVPDDRCAQFDELQLLVQAVLSATSRAVSPAAVYPSVVCVVSPEQQRGPIQALGPSAGLPKSVVQLPSHFSRKLAVRGQLSKPCIINELQGSTKA
jgi:hypothetical protein